MLRMRGTVARSAPWDVPVDLFFYRDPEELEKAEEAQAFADQQVGEAAYEAPKEQPYSEPGAMAGFAAPPEVPAAGGVAPPAAPEFAAGAPFDPAAGQQWGA